MDPIESLGDRTRTLEVAEQRQAGNGPPAHFAMDGTEYWDYTNSDLYVNDSGLVTYGNSWVLIGGGSGLTGTLTLDDGANWRITLTFTDGVLTGQTTGASVAATATWV